MAECKRTGATSGPGSTACRTFLMRSCRPSIQLWKSVGAVVTVEILECAGLEDLDLLLGLLEPRLAILQQLGAALVCRQGLLERQLPRLHRCDNVLDFSQRGLEGLRVLGFGFGHGQRLWKARIVWKDRKNSPSPEPGSTNYGRIVLMGRDARLENVASTRVLRENPFRNSAPFCASRRGRFFYYFFCCTGHLVMTDLANVSSLTRTPVQLPIDWYFDPRIAGIERKL